MKIKRILKIFMVFLLVFSLLIPKFLSTNTHTVTANDNGINDEWTIDDFIIENDTIYGFSKKGSEKLKKNGKVILPTEKNGVKITKVASFAFHPDKKKEIEDYIGREGKNGEKNNKDVDGNEIRNIGESFNNTLIKSVTIPDGYEYIGQDAFDFNESLNELKLASTITRISDYAFAHIALDKSLELPSELKTLGDSAFMESQITGSLVLPEKLESLGERTFKNNKISNIEFKGKKISELGEKVFEDNRIESINIPNSIKKIASDAFNGNYGNEEYNYIVTLWTEHKNNPNKLFGASFYVDPSDDLKVKKPEINYKIWENADFKINKNVIEGFSNRGLLKVKKNKNLKIPSEHNGIKLTQIADDAFRNINFRNESLKKYDLESVTLPNSIEKIGNFAFQSNYITELDVQDCENLTEIGKGAFMNNKISTLNLNDHLKLIDDAAFHINNLEFVFIPKNVEKIGISAFRNNKINMLLMNSEKLSEIGEMAFLGNAIAQVDLTQTPNLKTIGVQAFAGNLITSVNLPYGVEEIREEAFRKNSIKEVAFPNSLKKIAFNSFDENPGNLEYKKVLVEITGGNINKIPDGNNFIVNKNTLAKDRTELKKTIEKIDSLKLDEFQEKTKKLFLDIKKEGELLLEKTNLREGEMLKYIFETNFLIDRSDIDILLKKAKKSLSNGDEKSKKLLEDKINYAEKSYNNSALDTRKLKRLKKELKFLTDLVNGEGEISKTVMLQGHHKLNSPLPIPSYHIGVNVYFDKNGKILYVLDMSYNIGKGTLNQYGTEVENVDEDNEGYHKLALDTLSDYEGLNYKEILSGNVDSIGNILKVEKAKYHREGMFEAIKDACKDYKEKVIRNEEYDITVVSLEETKFTNLKLSVEKINSDSIKNLRNNVLNAFDIQFKNLNDKKVDMTGKFKVILNKKFSDVKAVYHLSESGELTSCKFSQTKETVSFETTHFSKYIIEYNKTKEKNSEGNNSDLENNRNNNISRNDTNTKANTKNMGNKLPQTSIEKSSILAVFLSIVVSIFIFVKSRKYN